MRLLILASTLLLACACASGDCPDTDVAEPEPPEPPSGVEVCAAWCEAGGARYARTDTVYGGLRCLCDLVVMDMVAMQPKPELPAEAPPKGE